MKSKLTYKQKLRLLGLSIIPTLLICYELALKNTIAEHAKYKHSLEFAMSSSEPQSTDLSIRKERAESLYDRYRLDTFSTDKNILSIASNYCRSNDLILKEYKTISLIKTDSFLLLTRTITFEGPFIPVLKLIYDLETKKSAGRINSIQFFTVMDRQDKSTKLNSTLYVQNIIPF